MSTSILGNMYNLSAVLYWYAAFFKTNNNNASLWDLVLFLDINKVVITLCKAFKYTELAHYK
jgi:hypothetical protein